MTEEREPDGFKLAAEQNMISARFNERTVLRKLPSQVALQDFSHTMLIASRNGVLATFSAMHPAMQKAVVNWQDFDPDTVGPTPLMEAAARGHVDIVKHLLNIGADIKQEDDEGRTALHRAAVGAKPAMVKLLLDSGADVNQRSIHGWMPLMEAVQHGKSENVRLLLERGAQTRVLTPDNEGLRAFALKCGHHAVADLIDAEEKKRGVDAAEKLVEKGTAETITVARPLKLKKPRA